MSIVTSHSSQESLLDTAAFSQLLRRIRAEYLEMPGLKLTAPQARRLWGLHSAACDAALAALMDSKFLSRTRDGLFVLTATLRSNPNGWLGARQPLFGQSGHVAHGLPTKETEAWRGQGRKSRSLRA